MKTILIVYLAFHFEGGATSTQTAFQSMEKCEAARQTIVSEFSRPTGDRWGFKRITAICVGS